MTAELMKGKGYHKGKERNMQQREKKYISTNIYEYIGKGRKYISSKVVKE